ncbi:MAG TPA: hypothetical protein PLN31_10470 [Azoarcus taiwanensis]|nr:hypothetical protein [Azoarcus taiwanensis]
MKKKLLAISMAAALGGFAGSASAMEVAESGIGLYNILPYYSVQEGNATLIHITNTDTAHGKAVKVRFRGAEWSDDVFDFQVFLSPGDVWTGAVTRNGDVARMTTNDTSCTLPANINQDFITFRLVEGGTAGTREGYVEILTMADIEYANPTRVDNANSPLANAIKHVNGVPACGAAVSGLQEGANSIGSATAPNQFTGDQLVAPTGSLMSYATVINVPASKAFTVAGTALEPTEDFVGVAAGTTTNYFRQANALIAASRVSDLTDDGIFLGAGSVGTAAGTGLAMYQFDMPDLSTPIASGDTPDAQRDAVAAALARDAVAVEYVTDDGLRATTDVVFNQPVRRFFYEYWRHATPVVPQDVAAYGSYTINGAQFGIRGTDRYAELNGAANRIPVTAPTFYDREEGTIVSSTDIVISPTPPSQALTYSLKGEASVLAINNGALPTGSLGASLTANNYDTGLSNPDGWATLSLTTPNGELLPTVGFTAINLFNAAVGAAGTNYGMTLPLRGNIGQN